MRNTEEQQTKIGAHSFWLNGLGGWLVMVGVSMFLRGVLSGVEVYGMYVFYTAGTLKPLIDPNSTRFIQGLSQALVFVLMTDLVLIVLNGYGLFLFFKRKRIFPAFLISILVLNVGVVLFIHYNFESAREFVGGGNSDLLGTLLGTLIWVPYLLRSRRVSATFIRD